MYAGVPNVMMSLWSVPDASTGQIMKSFYEFLEQGQGKAEALRLAKLNYLEMADGNTRAPYFWAGFSMIGDNKPIVKRGAWYEKWYWLTGLVLVLIGLGIVLSNQVRKPAT